MLTQLVYASSAVAPLGPSDLEQIVRTGRRNNAAAGVTGALLYHGGNVMQALEGPEAGVEAIFARIRDDPRHRGVLVLYRGPVEARTYPDWAVGLLHPEAMAGTEGVRGLDELTGPGPSRAHRLLRGFRAVVGR